VLLLGGVHFGRRKPTTTTTPTPIPTVLHSTHARTVRVARPRHQQLRTIPTGIEDGCPVNYLPVPIPSRLCNPNTFTAGPIEPWDARCAQTTMVREPAGPALGGVVSARWPADSWMMGDAAELQCSGLYAACMRSLAQDRPPHAPLGAELYDASCTYVDTQLQ
jgi:hypothetical protein